MTMNTEAPRRTISPARGQHANILLVEDNPADADLTRYGLANAKLANHLDVVEDGEQALDYVYQRGEFADAPRPDLILLDLNLPGTDGREVLRELKANPDLAAIPVVILSTSVADRDVLGAYKDHANAYMNKPVDFEQFTELVKGLENYWFSLVRLPPDS